MKTFQNRFEIFGPALPAEAESARAYAESYLSLFVEADHPEKEGRWYRFDEGCSMTTGYANEIAWQQRLYAATENREPYEWDPESFSGIIEEERLLDFLMEAVEEVPNVEIPL